MEHCPLATVVQVRDHLSHYATGAGVELGPGHNPFPVPTGTIVTYVDRWTPDESARLFPELDGAQFPSPDLVANFDTDRLSVLDDESEDFVICSHLLEHLANPLSLLVDIHRVLVADGLAILILPDRRATFDSSRSPTPLAHLVRDYESGVSTVSAEHLHDFLEAIGGDPEFAIQSALTPRQHLLRSIHVHCWTDEEFYPVISYCSEALKCPWVIEEWVPTTGIEFGFVLRKL